MDLVRKVYEFANKVFKKWVSIKIQYRFSTIKKKYIDMLVFFGAIIIGLALSFIVISKVQLSGVQPIQTVNIVTDNKAEELFYGGQYDSAINEYLDIFKKDNKSPIWYLKIAEIYSIKGELETSRDYILQAKKLRNKVKSENLDVVDKDFMNKDIEFLNYLVFTEFMNKDFKLAMEDGEIALQEYKSNKKIVKTMLPVYMANGETDKAKVLVSLYVVDGNSASDIAENARMKMLLDQWDEGLDVLKYAWYIDRDEYKIFDILAQISAFSKDKLLEKIIKLSEKEPEELSYKMWLAKIYSMREETSEMAQKILNEVQSKNVGFIEKTLIQYSIYEKTKQIEKADELIKQLIEENGNDYRVLHTAGWFYLAKNDLEKAMEYCKKSIVKNKNYPDNYGFLLPEILKAMGKDVEGEPYFRTALLKEPYNYNIMITIATYYWCTTKNSDKSLEYFKLAEILKPNEAEIKYEMALIQHENGHESEAVELLKQTIKLEPGVPKFHRTLGTIFMVTENYDDGIKEIRNAYETDKEDILTLNNVGCYYITITMDLEKGEYNLQKAYEGISNNTDDYFKKTITENYEKAKKLLESYKSGKEGESLQIPELVLFF